MPRPQTIEAAKAIIISYTFQRHYSPNSRADAAYNYTNYSYSYGLYHYPVISC